MEKHVQTTTRLTEGALTVSFHSNRDSTRFALAATGHGSIRTVAQGIDLTDTEARTLYRMLDEFFGPKKAEPSGGSDAR